MTRWMSIGIVVLMCVGFAGCATVEKYNPWSERAKVTRGITDALEAGLKDSPATMLTSKEDQIVVTFRGDVTFDTGSSVVKPQAKADLEKVALILKDYPTAKAVVAGHTDSIGKKDFNQALSEKRAQAARNVMIVTGVDRLRLGIIGYGESVPLGDNKTPEGRQMNRRVEILITPMTIDEE